MFLKGKKAKQIKNVNAKRIDYLLNRNFFTIEELRELSKRKALKVIRLIAKAERLNVSRAEAKQLLAFILSEQTQTTPSTVVFELFTFLKEKALEFVEQTTFALDLIASLVFNFRLSLKRVFRI